MRGLTNIFLQAAEEDWVGNSIGNIRLLKEYLPVLLSIFYGFTGDRTRKENIDLILLKIFLFS